MQTHKNINVLSIKHGMWTVPPNPNPANAKQP